MTYAVNITTFPNKLPILEAAGFVLLPRGNLPLTVHKTQQLKLVNYAIKHDRYVGVVQQKPSGQKHKSLFETGCLGKISTFMEKDQGDMVLVLTGLTRFHLIDHTKNSQGLTMGHVSYAPYASDAHPQQTSDAQAPQPKEALIEQLHTYLKKYGINANWDEIASAPHENLVTAISMLCPFDPFEKQALLESATTETRAEMATSFMQMACSHMEDHKTRH